MKTTEKNIMKQLMRKIFILVVVLLVLAGVIIFAIANKQVEIIKSTFIEAPNVTRELTGKEKENINRYLEYLQIHEESRYVFSTGSNGNSSMDLYNANAVVSLVTLIPGYNVKELCERMQFLKSINPETLDFLNLIYMSNIGHNLKIELDFTKLNDCLCKFYDEQTKLFFVGDPNDGIHIELVATINVLRSFKSQLDTSRFHVVEGVKMALAHYKFLTGSNETMYNSGGDILCCLGELGLQQIVDDKLVENWLGYWRSSYDTMTITSLSDALSFSSFAEVMQVFAPDYGRDRIYSYYCSLDQKQLEEIDDISMLSDVLKKSDELKDNSVNDILIDKVNKLMGNMVETKLDVRSTAFGVALAQKTGFQYDEEKVGHFIEDNYRTYIEINNIYDRVSILYYNLMLDQLVNGYDQNYNKDFFQNQINTLLGEMEFEEQNLAAEIITARRIVEIASDLRMFDVDISLRAKQCRKLRNALIKFSQDDFLANSVLIIDAYIIDSSLSLGLINKEDVKTVLLKLVEEGGGSRQYLDETVCADVYTTYLFFSLLNSFNDFTLLESQQSFVSSLKVEDGVFAFSTDPNIIDLSTIAYGNSIFGFSYGGDDDANKRE